MSKEQQSNGCWCERSGCMRLGSAMRMAFAPARLGLVLIALTGSLVLGMVLDRIWLAADRGVTPAGCVGVIHPSPEAAGGCGVFAVWWANERTAALGSINALAHLRLGELLTAPPKGEFLTPGQFGQTRGLLGCGWHMVRALKWLVVEYPLFALLFLGLSLPIWALLGGAAARINALQFARDERLDVGDALRFARRRFWDGFLAAPAFAFGLTALVGLVLWLGAMGIAIPWIGDLLGGVLFVVVVLLGLFGGAAALASLAAGSLFWPAVAVDDATGIEAVLHTIAYVRTRVVRAAGYGLAALIAGLLCWAVAVVGVWAALRFTHLLLSAGSGLWTDRAVAGGGDVVSKIAAVWSLGGPGEFFGPAAGELLGRDRVLRFLIGLWMYLLSGLMWSLLVNVWLAGSTAVYFLLRRDVDNVDLGQVRLTEEEDKRTADVASETPPPVVVEVPSGEPGASGPGAAEGA